MALRFVHATPLPIYLGNGFFGLDRYSGGFAYGKAGCAQRRVLQPIGI